MIYTNCDSRLRSHPRLLAKPVQTKGHPEKEAIPTKKRTPKMAPTLCAIALLLALAPVALAEEASRTVSRGLLGGLSPITLVVLSSGLCAAFYGTLRGCCAPSARL